MYPHQSFSFKKKTRFSILSLIVYICFSFSANSQTTLAAGDIAIIGYDFGYNTTTPAPLGNDNFSIVALKNISSGTIINFTGNGWLGSAFTTVGSNDGFFTWTTGTINAGAVFNFSLSNGTSSGVTSPAVITVSPLNGTISGITSTGFTSTAGYSPLNGNQIFIFQGTQASPTFIYGVNTEAVAIDATGWNPIATVVNNAVQSTLPSGLTNAKPFDGTVAAPTALPFSLITNRYNAVYIGPKAGTQIHLLDSIGDIAYWSTSTIPTTPYDLSVGGTYFAGVNPVFTISGTLALSWLNFSVQQNAGLYSWNWNVADEKNVAYYIPQYSSDGIAFTDGGKIAILNKSIYQFSKTLSLDGNIYFRVKEVDVNGNVSYSGTHSLNNSLQNTLSFYPNPVRTVLNIEWPYEDAKSVSIVIVNSEGKIVLQQTNRMIPDIKLKLSTLTAGTYFIACEDDKQHKLPTQSFVKEAE